MWRKKTKSIDNLLKENSAEIRKIREAKNIFRKHFLASRTRLIFVCVCSWLEFVKI